MSTPKEGHSEFEDKSPILDAIGSRNPFEVPQNYFENQEQILRFELLNTVSKDAKKTFGDVSENYFETNKLNIKKQLTELNPARNIIFSTQKWYAVAAMLVVLLSVSLLWFNHSDHFDTARQTQKDTATLINAKDQHRKKFDPEKTEIENYLLNYYSVEDLAMND